MMPPTFSLLHATRGRPAKAVECMRMWHERCSGLRTDVEYIFACDNDDSTVHYLMDMLSGSTGFSCKVICGDHHGSAPAWDAAYRASTGRILVQVSDDMEPPVAWNDHLFLRLPPMWENEPLVIAVSDGLRRDRLMTLAICTRAYADWKGEFLHAGYQSMLSDDDLTFRAYRDQQAGNCRVIEARNLVFTHRHHCAYPEVPEDDTYRHQNRPEAYRAGMKLFNERNPHAHGKEAKIWL